MRMSTCRPLCCSRIDDGSGKVHNAGSVSSMGNLVLSGSSHYILAAGRNKALIASSVSIASAANLDLNDDFLIVNYGSETTNATRSCS